MLANFILPFNMKMFYAGVDQPHQRRIRHGNETTRKNFIGTAPLRFKPATTLAKTGGVKRTTD